MKMSKIIPPRDISYDTDPDIGSLAWSTLYDTPVLETIPADYIVSEIKKTRRPTPLLFVAAASSLPTPDDPKKPEKYESLIDTLLAPYHSSESLRKWDYGGKE